MTKQAAAWEYRLIERRSLIELEAAINQLGSEGWEAIQYASSGSDRGVLMKRPLQDEFGRGIDVEGD